MTLPEAEAAYLRELTARLRALLGADLIGVYPTGSVALDAYLPGRSDLDLIAVAESPTPAAVGEIAAALAHEALPCPAAGLEFVLYDRAALAALTTQDGFALNLNTDRDLPPLVEQGPSDRPGHWYPIDRDITAQQDRALTGPAFTTLAHRPPAAELRPVVAASVAANLEPGAEPHADALLNACRALRWHDGGHWTGKADAAGWAMTRHSAFASLLTAALNALSRERAADRTDPGEARSFLTHALLTLDGEPAVPDRR
ncbi:nucleotidyltransferase domain-containing protein [Phytomonospora sp. NPDC050363]|uniref:aminoglycoside adenylyltransferase domain-containing protein n=1 Tax=Phytomonospora sp. NPDC050363 TaxID=3155642 RepID=UPI0033E9E464